MCLLYLYIFPRFTWINNVSESRGFTEYRSIDHNKWSTLYDPTPSPVLVENAWGPRRAWSVLITSYWFDKLPPNACLIYHRFGHHLSVKMLTPQQQRESSTFRDLLEVTHLIRVHQHRWAGKRVRILFVDNAAVVKIYQRGSSIPHLHRLVKELVFPPHLLQHPH